ncbi:hypothetical protein LTR10_020066 [Elasticomyces elasticus]|uniref:BTB domain-containing protein n=1 Tax=Exophiala sideris TaxID=1016849 RepID=A0ABR0IVA5_9EURO|nr:hypothetical protein LTR10_020066 [Elasticomyces elasticus]KAK5021352.1 hypothetical protein LTS07_011095 [Exophiala sideris]KAK5024300.1 hypothetical protein LTR13_010921 [Exophiala sideris]KAK5049243.1 hypothetical protein LTR69_011118 [Exophiala sideris]KAK5176555.1 hypothetical protein LTR44_010943 [Eurotiomycetes sp. CCFEE 6388]
MKNSGGFGDRSHWSAKRQRLGTEGILFGQDSSQSASSDPDSIDDSLFLPDSTRRDMLPRNQATRSRHVRALGSHTTPLLTPLSSPSDRRNDSNVHVKTEEELRVLDLLKATPHDQHVKIYVGPSNKVYTVSIGDLEKSPILKAMVSQDSADGPYIMHPALTEINPNHFLAVQHFLIMDEYIPAIVSNPRGNDIVPKQLDGLNSVDDYRAEAVRSGHLYIIAKRLGMTTMQDLVVQKVTQAQYQQYGIKCLLELAKVVFSRPEDKELLSKTKSESPQCGRAGEENEDPLEKWLIESLKRRLQTMMLRHAPLFFEIANHGACARRGFESRILKRRVEELEASGGSVIIEDDE